MENKVTIDAARLLRLNRAVDALPALVEGYRVIEDLQTEEGDRAIADAKQLMVFMMIHNHAAWNEVIKSTLDAVYVLLLSDEWQLQRLAGLLLCKTLRQYPDVIAGALENIQQTLLT